MRGHWIYMTNAQEEETLLVKCALNPSGHGAPVSQTLLGVSLSLLLPSVIDEELL